MLRDEIARQAKVLAGTAAIKLQDYSRTAQREAARALHRGNEVRLTLQRIAARDLRINLEVEEEVNLFNARAVALVHRAQAQGFDEEERLTFEMERGTLQLTVGNAKRELRRNAGIRTILNTPRFYTQYIRGQLGEDPEAAAITYAQTHPDRQESVPLTQLLKP